MSTLPARVLGPEERGRLDRKLGPQGAVGRGVRGHNWRGPTTPARCGEDNQRNPRLAQGHLAGQNPARASTGKSPCDQGLCGSGFSTVLESLTAAFLVVRGQKSGSLSRREKS